MKKTIVALTTGLFLASGATAFADSSILDVQDVPPRTTSQDLVPDLGLTGGDNFEAYSAQNNFGDRSPASDNSRAAHGVDYTPTAAIDGTAGEQEVYSPQNGWGDHGYAN